MLDGRGVPLVVDPVMVASSGAKLLRDDAVEALVRRIFPLATVVTPNLLEARALTGSPTGVARRELAERLVELGARAAIVTGGHGEDAVDHLFDGRAHVEIPVERIDSGATHGAGCTHSATLAAGLAKGLPLEDAARAAAAAAVAAVRNGLASIGAGDGPVDVSQPERKTVTPGETLLRLRETRPLVHQITNYVVMNETANATLAVGGQPVMAHAREEVEEMVALAGALVLNIGTLSPDWVEAMLAAGRAANARGIPVVLDPVGAGATTYRTETVQRILDVVRVTVVRGNAGEVATIVGVEAEVRGVESVGVSADPAELALQAARTLGLVVSVTGPVDHASDGERVVSVSNGDPVLATITGTGCMSRP